MNKELINQLMEAEFMPFEIERMTKEEIINEETFNYILSIEDDFKRENIIMQIEEKAKEKKCLSNFKNLLKKDNNQIMRENKRIIRIEKMKHNELGDKLLEENSIKLYGDKLYIYDNGVYKEDKITIDKKIIEIQPDSNSGFRKEVYLYLLLNAEKAEIDKESNIVNFKNGLYHIDKKKLYSHTPEIFSINQIDINYCDNCRKVEAIDKYLDRLSSYKKERKQAILEMIGYAMTTSVKFQKAFIMYGEKARNGKSTSCKLITKLIGKNNVGNVSFKDMNKNRFATKGIKGKLLNIGAEMSEEYIEDVSMFKMFISRRFFRNRRKI